MRYKIPMLLIWFRLFAGLAILLLAFSNIPYSRPVSGVLLIAGLLSDILDGVVARRLGVSGEKLRRMDSAIDQVFWVLIIISCYVLAAPFFKDNLAYIIVLAASELLIYAVSYIKFRKEVATHAIASKIWTLTLAAALMQLILTGNSGWLFQLCFYLGMLTRMEIVMILLILREWANDVPSVYHAVLIRNNKRIKRNKLFNG